ncbi:MAG: carbohydrate ABC transporter substrate-binding protein [Anaerolineae bacterium]|nr:carbohydrate ABC transporter substrate-binding protein [Anaerolineae bacterium]
MRKITIAAILATLMLALSLPGLAQDVVELRMTWYTDGNEDEVMRDLLDRFEMENSDIRVVMDNVPYQAGILEALPVQLAAGEGPDMARVTNLGGLAEFYLDLTPHLSDPDYWLDSFGGTLGWLRQAGQMEGIHGFPTQLTITGPIINRTLFEQAGVAVPSDASDQVTWEEWAAAANEVADILEIPFPMAMDRSGHRFAGPAISMGAKYFDDEGHPLVAGDEGFRAMAELFVNWHNEGTMPLEIWAANTGYAGANEEFGNSQVVFYMSGSWQVGQFTDQIGDAFDWQVVPNPCGPGGCTGMPGGASLVAISDTEHPAEVARVMEYLAREDILGEFSARTLFIPAHRGLATSGVDFDTDLELAKAALGVFTAQVGTLEQTAFDLQGYPFNFLVFNAARDRLTQAIVGELTLDEAIERIQEDVDEQLAEQMGG